MNTMTWTAERDKYGRPVKKLIVAGKVKGVVCTLPKGYVELYPHHGRYLVNDWSMGYQAKPEESGQVTYHATLGAAKKFLAER